MVFFLSMLARQNRRMVPSLLKYGLSARFAVIKKTVTPARIPDMLPHSPVQPEMKKEHNANNPNNQNQNGVKHDGLIYDNVDNFILDSFCLLPFAQKIISIEIHDDLMKLEKEAKTTVEKPSMLDEIANKFWDKTFGKFMDDLEPVQDKSPEEKSNVNPLLNSFEAFVLPALFPNGLWGDRHRWQFNHRFVLWLRKEFLVAKFGQELLEIFTRYPTLKINPDYRDDNKELKENDNNTHTTNPRVLNIGSPTKLKFLPSKAMVLNAFKLHDWNRNHNDRSQQKHMIELTKSLGGDVRKAHDSLHVPLLSDDTCVNHLTLENMLELTGAHVSNCGSFNLYCEQRNVYEFWTQEYIEGLANYLLDRSVALASTGSSKDKNETIILEVGAGDGTLSMFLGKSLEILGGQRRRTHKYRKNISAKKQKQMGNKKTTESSIKKNDFQIPKIIATDDGSWNIKAKTNRVQKVDVKEALAKYAEYKNDKHHIIVICSWMMKGMDWTADFRAAGVDEYILIGEADDGCCGHNWKTWGNQDFIDSSEIKYDISQKLIPPFEADGFERINLIELSKMQFSRYDSKASRSSSTVCFRKYEKNK